MPASSQASSELSTASLMVVSSALEGLSKPSRWRFLVKNSEMEISRCFVAICSAVARRRGERPAAGPGSTGSSGSTSGSGAGGGGAAFPLTGARAGPFAERAGALAGATSMSESCRSAFAGAFPFFAFTAAVFLAAMVP